MNVKDLQPRQGNVDIVLDVMSMGDIREFSKFGKPGRVANAVAKDETGEIKLSLWNEQIDQIKKGDRIQIKNGYVNEWKGEKQLTTGRNGTIEVISSSGGDAAIEPEPRDEDLTEDEVQEEDIEE